MRVSERCWWRVVTSWTAWFWRSTAIIRIAVDYLPVIFLIENLAVFKIMSKNTLQSLQMTVWCMRIAFWITKVTDTHPEFVILVAFRLQEWLHDRASMLRYKHTVCFVSSQSLFGILPSTWMTFHNSAVRLNSTVRRIRKNQLDATGIDVYSH